MSESEEQPPPPARMKLQTIPIPPTRQGMMIVGIPKGSRRIGFRHLRGGENSPALVVLAKVRAEPEIVQRQIRVVREDYVFDPDDVDGVVPEAYLGGWRYGGHYFYAFDGGPHRESEQQETDPASADSAEAN